MTRTQRKKTKKKRDPLIYIVLFTIIVLLFAVAGLSMLKSTPSDYHPFQQLATDEVSPYLTHKLAPDLYNKVQLDRPFRIEVEQYGLNDIISRYEWPQEFDGVKVDKPSVVIDAQAVKIMGTVTWKRIPMVVTISALPQLDEQGRLNLNIQQVKAGKVSITPLARTITAKVIEKQVEKGHDEDWIQDLAAALLRNEPFVPVWPTIKDIDIQLTEIQIEDEIMYLMFKPLEKKS